MATLVELEAEKRRLESLIAAETLKLSAIKNRIAQLQSRYDQLNSTAPGSFSANVALTALTNAQAEEAQIIRTLTDLQAQLSAIVSQIQNFRVQPTAVQSTGQTVREDQLGRGESASPGAPPPRAEVDKDGRVVPAQAPAQTNAQRFVPAFDQAVNATLRKNTATQSTPASVAQPGGARPGPEGPVASQTAGAAAPGDDGSNDVRNRLNTIFAGANQGIVTQPNPLDRYSSYTYNLSLYIVNEQQYRAIVETRNLTSSGWQLLMRSGGAPLAGGEIPPISQDEAQQIADGNGQAPATNLGRNQFFPLDFYMDDVRLRTYPPGKGSGGAHSGIDLSFKIIEPNGLTLLDNLYAAAQQFNNLTGGDPVNYAAQTYMLVVRFYGYDQQGNYLGPCKGRVKNADGSWGPEYVIEKYIPFLFKNITFRIANRLVEYDCQAAILPVVINQGIRGTIPYDVEIPATTLKDLFAGNKSLASQTAASTASSDGRTSTSTPATSPPATPGSAAATAGSNTSGPSAPPPKANAAANPNLVYGLMEALNKYQAEKVKDGTFLVADQYEIEFTDSILAEAEVNPPGPQDKKTKPMVQTQDPATAKLGNKQAVNNNAKTTSARAGTSIVQFIDQYTRTSSYITKQQLKIATQDSTGKILFIPQPAAAGQVIAWYRIGMEATPIKYDYLRNDYAYRMKFQLSPYKINSLESEYFPTPDFNGVHKKYNYWFTGENSQVLRFDQNFNYLYFVTVNGEQDLNTRLRANETTNKREFLKYAFQSRSAESSQGASGPVLDASATAADYLYSPADQGRIKIEIVGDPSWIAQGEVWKGISELEFNYQPFLTDGTINYESQEALFEVLFNKPSDYNLQTGLLDPNQNTYGANRPIGKAGEASQTYIYNLVMCTSVFNRGRFTQELEGVIKTFDLTPFNNSTSSVSAAETDREGNNTSSSDVWLRGPDQSDAETARLKRQSLATLKPGLETSNYNAANLAERQNNARRNVQNAWRGQLGITDPANPQPQLPTLPPTSGGLPVGTASTPVAARTGASGPAVGIPTVAVRLNNGSTQTVTAQEQINQLLTQNQITFQTASAASVELSQKQQAANSPVTNTGRQLMNRE